MKGLIVDTTSEQAFAAAFDGEKTAVVYLSSGVSTASALVPAVEEVLSSLALRKEDLDGVSAVVGPGSFTGIRIGVTFMNAFAFALKIPRFRITTFDVMRAVRPDAPAYAVDAGHNSCYAEMVSESGSTDENKDISELPQGTVYRNELSQEMPKGALTVLSRAIDQHVYALCAPSYLTDLLKPYYMRKSQAERMKEASHD